LKKSADYILDQPVRPNVDGVKDARREALSAWVSGVLPSPLLDLTTASADASFRRYFRAHTSTGTFIVMDAPPAHEDCKPFLHVARLFREAGANTPEILAENLADGFLLLTDFGDTTYLAALEAGVDADRLYRAANAELVTLQQASRPGALPAYDRALLTRELQLFPDWYVGRHLAVELSPAQQADLGRVFESLLANIFAQPKVYVHRDWHSRNLMFTGAARPGVIDFQDAVYGPVTYDLVSIYKDAYVEWEEAQILDWVIRYWESARQAGVPVQADFGEFYRDFEWMGVQRHLKVLGIFARLYHRDGKAGYLKDMPRVMAYLRKACERYTELHALIVLLDALEGKSAEVGYTF